MRVEPGVKRVTAFVDGQNLFYAVKKAFGYSFPNYDLQALAKSICLNQGWNLQEIHFYTGIPNAADDAFWNQFWTAKMAVMGTRGIKTFSRPLRYRPQTITLPSGTPETIMVGQEKGIDIRIALDIVRLARENRYDVALIFSQDQDLSEVVNEVRSISQQQDKWIKLACAFPVSPTYKNSRGISGADWIKFERGIYDCCLDNNDYRPKKT